MSDRNSGFARYLIASAAAVALLAPGIATADTAQPPYFYVGVMGGTNFLQDSDSSFGGVDNNVDFETGFGVAGYAGYKWSFGVRTELEVGYRDNDVDTLSGTGTAGSNGESNAWSVMGNVVYDIPTGTRFTPYVGAGIGYADIDFNSIGTVFTTQALDGGDEDFAYQAIAGVSYDLTREIAVNLDYRYFAALDPEIELTGGTSANVDYNNHTVMVGLRYKFLAPPPPPPPAPTPVAQPAPPPPPPPPPPITRNYIVFFDFDESLITGPAASILQDAARNVNQAGITRIEVTGHTDTSGSIAYNEGLSLRRANAVRDQLVNLGVAASDIAIFARGESQPLIATGDGVREPQNRRVEIVLQ